MKNNTTLAAITALFLAGFIAIGQIDEYFLILRHLGFPLHVMLPYEDH